MEMLYKIKNTTDSLMLVVVYFQWSQWICLAGCLSLPTRCVDQRAGNQTGNCYSYVGKLSGKPSILVHCIFLIRYICWCLLKINNFFGGTFLPIFQNKNECMFVHHTVWFVVVFALFAKWLYTLTILFFCLLRRLHKPTDHRSQVVTNSLTHEDQTSRNPSRYLI